MCQAIFSIADPGKIDNRTAATAASFAALGIEPRALDELFDACLENPD